MRAFARVALARVVPRARRASTTIADADGVALTEASRRRLREIARERGSAEAWIRLAVRGGGCGGFAYEFTLEDADARAGAEAGADLVFASAGGGGGVGDATSYEFVRGSTIDYVEEMMKSSFEVVTNPRARSRCGCGSSFDPAAEAFGT